MSLTLLLATARTACASTLSTTIAAYDVAALQVVAHQVCLPRRPGAAAVPLRLRGVEHLAAAGPHVAIDVGHPRLFHSAWVWGSWGEGSPGDQRTRVLSLIGTRVARRAGPPRHLVPSPAPDLPLRTCTATSSAAVHRPPCSPRASRPRLAGTSRFACMFVWVGVAAPHYHSSLPPRWRLDPCWCSVLHVPRCSPWTSACASRPKGSPLTAPGRHVRVLLGLDSTGRHARHLDCRPGAPPNTRAGSCAPRPTARRPRP